MTQEQGNILGMLGSSIILPTVIALITFLYKLCINGIHKMLLNSKYKGLSDLTGKIIENCKTVEVAGLTGEQKKNAVMKIVKEICIANGKKGEEGETIASTYIDKLIEDAKILGTSKK